MMAWSLQPEAESESRILLVRQAHPERTAPITHRSR